MKCKWMILFIFFIFSFIHSQCWDKAFTPDDSTIVHWVFIDDYSNDVRLDLTANNQDLIEAGTFDYENQFDGTQDIYYLGNSLNFDGTDDYFYRAQANSTIINPELKDFTIECWITTPSSWGSNKYIAAYGDGYLTVLPGWRLYQSSSGSLQFSIAGSGAVILNTNISGGANQVLATSTNYYIAITADRDGSLYYYANGTQQPVSWDISADASESISQTHRDFTIGAPGTKNLSQVWDGYIWEVMITERAKSESEINDYWTAYLADPIDTCPETVATTTVSKVKEHNQVSEIKEY